MVKRDTAQGLFLASVGLTFGATALRYPVGTVARFGPGFFPLVVSAALLLLGAGLLVRSRFTTAGPVGFNLRNVAIILAALGGFVLATKLADMAAGIAVLVFVAGLAGRAFSWRLSAAVTLALIGVAFAFETLLGLRLRVF